MLLVMVRMTEMTAGFVFCVALMMAHCVAIHPYLYLVLDCVIDAQIGGCQQYFHLKMLSTHCRLLCPVAIQAIAGNVMDLGWQQAIALQGLGLGFVRVLL